MNQKEQILDWLNEWHEQLPTEATIKLLEVLEGATKTTNYIVRNSFEWNSTNTFQVN